MKTDLCDICRRRPTRWDVPVFDAWTRFRREREPSRIEEWCDPCHDAVLAKYPGEFMWPPRGVWLEPDEIPA